MKTKIQLLLIIVLFGMILISGCLNQTDTNTNSLVKEQPKNEKLELKEKPEKPPEKTLAKESDWCTKENFNLSVFGTAFNSGGTSSSWNLISAAVESKTIVGKVIEMCCGKLELGGEVGNEKFKMELIFNCTACYDKNKEYTISDMKSYYNGNYTPEGSYLMTGWRESGKECHKVIDGNGKIMEEGCE